MMNGLSGGFDDENDLRLAIESKVSNVRNVRMSNE